MDFKIKSATIDDISLILFFIKELAAYEELLHEVTATESILKKTLFGKRRYAEVILGYVDNEPVSFAVYFYNFSTFTGRPGIYLEDFYVKPKVRKKGVGKKMLAYLAHLSRQKNCTEMAWCVLHNNELAIRFYERIGAKPMKDWRMYRITGKALHDLASEWHEDHSF